MTKRKKLFLLPTILSLFVGLIAHNDNVLVKAETATQGQEYSITSFKEVPADWTINKACDVSNSSMEVQNGELVVSHKGTNCAANNYYGLMSTIGEGYQFENFTFKMNFIMISAENSSRWFGIAYHTLGKDETTKGYLMNFRQSGESAASAFVKGNFVDEAKVNSEIPLNDNQYHTLKIVMDGPKVRHYMDDKLITSWDVNIKNSNPLGVSEYLKSGGFSLIVNRSVLSIKSISVYPEAEKQSEDEKRIDDELVETYRWDSSLINFPTVVSYIKSASDLNKINETTMKPSNAILKMDHLGNIVDENNVVIDTFYNIYLNVLKKKVIPVIYLESEAAADALSSFLKNKIDILDIAVMSSNASYITRIRRTNTKIRAILLAKENANNMYELVKQSQICGAATIALPQALASIKNVTYLQARFKAVWVEANSTNKLDLYQSINSGALGIITSDYEKVYEIYKTYSESAVTRAGFNVAHRGLPKTYNENSLSGMKAAMENGATHLEIDCYLTTDQEVVIMHDADISRTTNGTGNIETYSLTQLRQFKLDVYEPYEDIPTLDDVISLVKGTDVIIVLEIKSAKGEIVGRIKDKLTQYDCYDQVVSISFNRDILGLMKRDLKEVPIAYLGAVNKDNLAEKLKEMGQYHYVFDTDYSNASREFNEYYLRDRGIAGWYWTFDNTAKTELVAINNGYVGITNNVADRFAKKVTYIEGIPYQLKKDEKMDSLTGLNVSIHLYNGNQETLLGKIFTYEEQDDHYDVICCLEVGPTVSGGRVQTFYTQVFQVKKYVEDDDPIIDEPSSTPSTTSSNDDHSSDSSSSSEENMPSSKGCGKASMGLLSLVSLITLLGVIVIRKK